MRSERARIRLPSPAGPMAMARKRHRRKRQQGCVDVAADHDLDADEPAGLGLEEGAVVVPVDDVRTHQRRQQRQDQRNRQAQQCRLHDGSGAGSRAASRLGPTSANLCGLTGQTRPFRPARRPQLASFGGESVSAGSYWTGWVSST